MTAAVPPIDPALRAIAAEDAAALWEEARREGLAIARRRLSEAYADAVVQAVLTNAYADRVRPAAPAYPDDRATDRAHEVETGCYVYAVIAGDEAGSAAGLPGIDPDKPVHVVTGDGVGVVVSEVDVAQMRAAGENPELSDESWLARAVRAHERVVTAAFHRATTIPMRFGLVYPDREAVEQMLARHRDALRRELHRLDGAAEWTLKISVDVETLRHRLAEPEPDSPMPTDVAGRAGTAFLLQRRASRQIDERVETFMSARVEGLATALESRSRDWSDMPASQPTNGGRPLMSRAFLVDHADEARFTAFVEDFAANTSDMGVSVVLDGPWPAYHFTRLRLEADDG